jgi:hypothetical protein
MDKKQYDKLACYYGAARSLKMQIENIQKLLAGIRRRSKAGCTNFRLCVYQEGKSPDRGFCVTIPEYVFRDAIVPALVDALAGLRADYKALPPIIVDELLAERSKKLKGAD